MMRTWCPSGRKKSKPVLHALSATTKLSTELISALRREQPPATTGSAQRATPSPACGCCGSFRSPQAKGVRAGTNGHVRRSKKLIAAAGRQLDRAGTKEKAARKEFKAAGVQIKPQ